ncbi:hypothetical protein ABT158_39735 [Nonomuraea sp. NPDC001636]|uniref:hypothetical protein n=1 Tax=Nonomuraea sp. NPDC001636 TaxID=3154391 RepID=UPI00331BA6BC
MGAVGETAERGALFDLGEDLAKSALVRTIIGCAPLSQAGASSRSSLAASLDADERTIALCRGSSAS